MVVGRALDQHGRRLPDSGRAEALSEHCIHYINTHSPRFESVDKTLQFVITVNETFLRIQLHEDLYSHNCRHDIFLC